MLTASLANNRNFPQLFLITLAAFFSIITYCYDEYFAHYTYDSYGVISAYLSLLFSFMNMKNNSKRVFLFFIFFFLFLFPFDFLISYIAEVPLIGVYKLNELPFIFLLYNIFQISCFFIVKANCEFNYRSIEFMNSKKIYYILLIILSIGIFLLKGSNIFTSQGTYQAYEDNLSAASGLNEYLLILAIFILFFRKNTIERLIFVLLMLFYVYKSISFGFRVQSIMAIFIIGITIVKKDPSKYIIWFSAFLGFFAILLFGFLKEGADVSKLGVKLLVDDRYGYAQSHQHGVLSSSSTVLSRYSDRLISEKILDIPSAVLSSTLPRRFVGNDIPRVYPSAYVQQYEYTPGGVLFIVHVYSLLGFPGYIVLLVLFVLLFSGFNKCDSVMNSKDKFFVVPVVTFFVFFVRWISYDFFNYGLRTLFILLLLFSIYMILKKLTLSVVK